MNLDTFQETINACRFCFMCRHLSAVGNVSFREADTPRGRALMCACLQRDIRGANPDFIDAFYRAELSAANRFHCVSHYDEAGLVLAAREDIVAAGRAPERVQALAAKLAGTTFTVQGKGRFLYALDSYAEAQPEIAKAFAALAGKSAIVRNADAAKALKVLGFRKEAAAVARRFARAVKGFKTVVTSSPAVADAFRNDFKLAGVEVLHSSEYLAALGLKGRGSRKASLLASDFLRNYGVAPLVPQKLLRDVGYRLAPFGTNEEETHAVGEGAVVFDQVNPELAAKLCARVRELAGPAGGTTIIVASPYTRAMLKMHAPELAVLSVEEAVAEAAGR